MTDNKQAILNGIATDAMYRMLREGQTYKLPSALSSFIASKGWEAVEYNEPETETKKVAQFDSLLSWVTASPVRGGLGSRMDVIVKFISQPMDASAAPECCSHLMNALEGPERAALAPMIARAAKANAESTGDRSWQALADAADQAVQRPDGRPEKTVDTVNSSSRPTGNSSAAGLRKLRRYSASDSLCAEYGIDQDAVTEQYGLTLRGEKSVHRALIDCGLKKPKTTAAGLGIDGDPTDVAQRIIKRLGPDRAALLVTALTTELTK